MWGLRPSGMLQRNKLITVQDSTRLELWVDTIEQTTLGLLDGQPLYQVIQHYAAYVVTVGWWRNIGFFIPIMERAVSDPVQLPPAMILSALAKLGAAAVSVLPSLHEALKRLDSWTAAQFGTTDDNLIIVKERHRVEVQQTIDAIEGRAGNVKG
jgi:hypothetical protein